MASSYPSPIPIHLCCHHECPPKIPARHHLMLLCVCDPLHLVCLSHFLLLMRLFGLSLSLKNQLPSEIFALLVPGTHLPCRQGSDLSALQQHKAKNWGSTYQHLLWEKVYRRVFYSCQCHRVPSKGEEREYGVGQPAETWSLQFGPSQLRWQVKMASLTPAK